MLVKIGDQVYDSNVIPMLLILSDKDKCNIAHMHPDATRYLSYPKSMSSESAVKILRDAENL